MYIIRRRKIFSHTLNKEKKPFLTIKVKWVFLPSAPSWKCSNRTPSYSRITFLPTATCRSLSQVNQILKSSWSVSSHLLGNLHTAGALVERVAWGSFSGFCVKQMANSFISQHFKTTFYLTKSIYFLHMNLYFWQLGEALINSQFYTHTHTAHLITVRLTRTTTSI